MSGGWKRAKPAGRRPLDGRVRRHRIAHVAADRCIRQPPFAWPLPLRSPTIGGTKPVLVCTFSNHTATRIPQEQKLIRKRHPATASPCQPPFEIASTLGNGSDEGRSGHGMCRQAIHSRAPLTPVLARRPRSGGTTEKLYVFAEHEAPCKEAETLVGLAAVSDSEVEHGA